MNRFLRCGNATFAKSGPLRPPHIALSLSLRFARHASLTAIHRGLRRSERVTHGSERPRKMSPIDSAMVSPRRDDSKPSARPSRPASEKEEPSTETSKTELSNRQQKRLEKMERKKALKQIPRKVRRQAKAMTKQTRRERFLDPDKSFGKKSVVYHLKVAEMNGKLAADGFKRLSSASTQDGSHSRHSDSQEPTRQQQSPREASFDAKFSGSGRHERSQNADWPEPRHRDRRRASDQEQADSWSGAEKGSSRWKRDSRQANSSTGFSSDARQQRSQNTDAFETMIRDRRRDSSQQPQDSRSGRVRRSTRWEQGSRQARSRTDFSDDARQQRSHSSDRSYSAKFYERQRASSREQEDSWSSSAREPAKRHSSSGTENFGNSRQPRPQSTEKNDGFHSSRPDRQRASSRETEDSWSNSSREPTRQHGSSSTDLSDGRQQRPQNTESNDRSYPSRSYDRQRGSYDRRRGYSRDAEDSWSESTRKMMPIAIKYTTAASQFLYGRSVVKAALEQPRRKLYNLYVQGGDQRADSLHNETMIQLAESQGVPVTIVPGEEQRLMDKMSAGRPHNGFVLEASPLPQIPVASLGAVEESAAGRVGFHVVRGFQTREEEAVNGTETFLQRQTGGGGGSNSSGPRRMPLVLLLHEIVDPGNLGALLRTANYLGVDAVGITKYSSANLSPAAFKSAAGAVDEVTMMAVNSPASFLEASRAAGWLVYAAVAPPEGRIVQIHRDKFVSMQDVEAQRPLLKKPCVLVLGNEGYGLPRPIKVAADYEVSIPRLVRDSRVDSLNVSVAGALLVDSFMRGVKEVDGGGGGGGGGGGFSDFGTARSKVDSVKKERVEEDDLF